MTSDIIGAQDLVDSLIYLTTLLLVWVCFKFSTAISLQISPVRAKFFSALVLVSLSLQVLLYLGFWSESKVLALLVKLGLGAALLALSFALWKTLRPVKRQANQQLAYSSATLNVPYLDPTKELSPLILDTLESGVLVVDKDLQIVSCNQVVCDVFGYSKGQLVNSPLRILLASDKASHHDLLMENFFKEPKQHKDTGTERIVAGLTQDGDEVHLHIALATVVDNNNQYAVATIKQVDRTLDDQKLHFELSNRLRRAIDASNDGIWEWNPKTEQIWCNLACKTLTNHPEGVEPALKYWWEHIHPDDLELIKMKLKEHSSHSIPLDIIYRGKDSANHYRWLHLRGDTVCDKNKAPLLTSGTLSDIDKVKRLEQTLAGKSQFLEAVIDKSLCGIYIYDIGQQKNVFINNRYTEITGFTLEELTTLSNDGSLLSLFHPDDLEKVEAHLSALSDPKKRASSAIEYRFKHKDNYWIWCLSKDSVYSYDSKGNVKEIIGTFFDISELKNREDEVRSLMLDFSTTFQLAAVGIAHVSLQGNWLKVNKKLCEILLYTEQEMIATTFQQITHPDDLNADLELMNALIAGESDNYTMEKRYIRSDGKVIWANLTVSIVRMNNGENSHFISVVEDISKRKKIENSLAESNESLERFAYSASHDMQEPLRKISAFSDSLTQRLKGKLDDESALYELDRISQSAQRMREMINSLLQLSRFSSQKLKKSVHLLSEVTKIAKDDISTILDESKAKIIVEQDLPLHIDLPSFELVLSNLFINSIRYSHPDKPIMIQIGAIEEAEMALIYVQDNGLGFKNEYAEEIFKPFKRLVGRSHPGHGMGLSICQKIINMHGGSISASSSVNEGALFKITIPLEKS
ncbi:PAS domain S-box protein [Aliikangiella sp. IMCC44632]